MRHALDLWKQVKAVNAQKHLLFQLLILHVQLGDLTNAVQSIAQSVAVNMHLVGHLIQRQAGIVQQILPQRIIIICVVLPVKIQQHLQSRVYQGETSAMAAAISTS